MDRHSIRGEELFSLKIFQGDTGRPTFWTLVLYGADNFFDHFLDVLRGRQLILIREKKGGLEIKNSARVRHENEMFRSYLNVRCMCCDGFENKFAKSYLKAWHPSVKNYN